MKKWITILLCAISFNVFALDLQQAKQQGLIGERPDGLLGAVVSSAEVNQIVKDINGQRIGKYKQIAGKNNMSYKQVSVLAGEKTMQKTPSGQFILNAAGQWVKK